ncbi:MAG: hypothetical protein N2Z76_00710 [Treponemataceae bacterium]|nr:hypothetical protein [Treponemataceae bacterium]
MAMQELIDTILTLVPIAVLIAIRLIMGLKNRGTALQKEKPQKGRFFTPLTEYQSSSVSEGAPIGGEKASGFSSAARNKTQLFPRRSRLPRGRPSQFVPPEEELRVIPQGLPPLSSGEKNPSTPSRKGEMGPLLQPLPEEQGMRMEVVERIERLPLLQRAVVWSEILGTPKGLD